MSGPEPVEYMLMVVDGRLQRVRVAGKLLADMRLHEVVARHYAAEAERLQAQLDQARTPTGEDIVREYYQRKKGRGKLTLRQFLTDIGIPEREGYIRKVKVAYDRQKRRRGRGHTR